MEEIKEDAKDNMDVDGESSLTPKLYVPMTSKVHQLQHTDIEFTDAKTRLPQ